MNPQNSKALAYDRISAQWESVISNYDTDRRVEVLVDEFLGRDQIAGKQCLDGGCGLGFFSIALSKRGGKVVSVDIGPSLVERLRARHSELDVRVGDLLDLQAALGEQTFELVLSSEAIEHTADPEIAVRNLCHVVGPAGVLVLSCPSRRWIWLLRLAEALRLRPHYQGYENWVRPSDLIRWIESSGFEIVRREGIHILPWQLLPKGLLRFLDRQIRGWSYPWSINLAVLARRKVAP